jgi:hypothetical protein
VNRRPESFTPNHLASFFELGISGCGQGLVKNNHLSRSRRQVKGVDQRIDNDDAHEAINSQMAPRSSNLALKCVWLIESFEHVVTGIDPIRLWVTNGGVRSAVGGYTSSYSSDHGAHSNVVGKYIKRRPTLAWRRCAPLGLINPPHHRIKAI